MARWQHENGIREMCEETSLERDGDGTKLVITPDLNTLRVDPMPFGSLMCDATYVKYDAKNEVIERGTVVVQSYVDEPHDESSIADLDWQRSSVTFPPTTEAEASPSS